MKRIPRLVIITLVAALALPVAALAAKGEKRKPATSTPTFSDFDKNSDEAVSEAEFVAESERRAAEMAKVHFARLDTDRDGKVSKAEFEAGATGTEKKRKGKNK
jgi:hypothetical protein